MVAVGVVAVGVVLEAESTPDGAWEETAPWASAGKRAAKLTASVVAAVIAASLERVVIARCLGKLNTFNPPHSRSPEWAIRL